MQIIIMCKTNSMDNIPITVLQYKNDDDINTYTIYNIYIYNNTYTIYILIHIQ